MSGTTSGATIVNLSFFICDVQGTHQIYHYQLTNNSIRRITEGLHDIKTIAIAGGDVLIGQKQSMALPTELFAFDIQTGEERQITFTNKELLDQLTMGKTEGRWMTTHDGQQMLTWIIYPPHFDFTKNIRLYYIVKEGHKGR